VASGELAGVTARLTVRVTPRARSNEIAPPGADGVLRVRVTAPPSDGRANSAVLEAIAAALGVAPSRLRVVSGGSSRTKAVEVAGMDAEEASTRLGLGSHP
jgi:uncharacterized protein YggU (UPF0235/DUF167 family)